MAQDGGVDGSGVRDDRALTDSDLARSRPPLAAKDVHGSRPRSDLHALPGAPGNDQLLACSQLGSGLPEGMRVHRPSMTRMYSSKSWVCSVETRSAWAVQRATWLPSAPSNT